MRRIFWIPEKNLMVMWAQKSACTSIAYWVMCGLLEQKPVAKGPRQWLVDNGYDIRPPEALTLIQKHKPRTVAFVRHPFDRLVSGYLDKFASPRTVDVMQMKQFSRTFYSQIKQMKKTEVTLASYRGLTFREFVIGARDVRRRREHVLNGHFNVQYSHEYRPSRFFPQTVFKNPTEGFRTLNVEYGVDYMPQRANRTTHGGQVANVWDINSIDLARSGASPSKESFLSEEMFALARDAHDIDYEVFGFADHPEWALQPA